MLIQFDNTQADIRKDADGFVSLTDLWKACGSAPDKAPAQWIRHNEAQLFIRASARFLKCVPESLLKSRRGRYNGGTWAVEQVALEYAQYLSPELAVVVNQVFLERIEEEKNPELAIQRGNERATRAWKKQGKSDEWIEARIKGVATRKNFTTMLASHGVKQEGFKNCTNAIYTPLFGGTAEVVRHKKNLPEKSNVRDSMSEVELAAVGLAELLAKETISRRNLAGNAQCELACTHASKSIASAIKQNRNIP